MQDGTFVVEHISFYEDGKLGTELTPDADWKRRGLYMGPSFDTLDVALQDGFDSFLKERGINELLRISFHNLLSTRNRRYATLLVLVEK